LTIYPSLAKHPNPNGPESKREINHESAKVRKHEKDKTDFVEKIFFFIECKEFTIKIDMAAKRRKKHKIKISGLAISMCYNEQKSKFRLFMNPSRF
jgi:hypothetical protein